MTYQKFKPHDSLLFCIDSYWTVKTDNPEPLIYSKIPNSLNDILIVLGEDFKTEENVLKSENVYLAGLKTHAAKITRQENTIIHGISFKAGGFANFYKFDSLSIVKNKIVELGNQFVPDFSLLIEPNIKSNLDSFYLNRLVSTDELYLKIITEIEKQKGQIRVRDIIKKFPISEKQLERKFNEKVGLPPKKFINLIRFRYAYKTIKEQGSQKSFLEIAFDCGYYDHSHLCNDIHKYTGISPSTV